MGSSGGIITPAAIGAAAESHTHLAADVTDLGGAAVLDVGTTADTVAAGDATVNLTGDQAVAGAKTFSSHPLISAGSSAGAGSVRAATELYVRSRGDNLVPNGAGLLGNNYPFQYGGVLTFDTSDTYGGGGSFTRLSAAATCESNEKIPIDGSKYYRQSVWAKAGNTDGTEFNPARLQYYGINTYDVDELNISSNMYMKISGAAETTLAAQLNPGDTTMTLTSAAGWYDGSTGYSRNIRWWPYVSSSGLVYTPYTYSRYTSNSYSSNSTLGMWSAGGISGSVVTLRVPWAGPILPSGTPVCNSTSGSSYKYVAMSAANVPNAWTYYSGIIGGWDTSGSGSASLFPPGAAFVSELILVNNGSAVADNRIRYSMRYLGTATTQNLETATSAVPGVVTAPATSVPGLVAVPASKTASGVVGQQAADANFAYFCVATNSWIRIAKDGTW